MPERLLDLLAVLFWEAMSHESSWYPGTFNGRCSWCGTLGAESGVLVWHERHGVVVEARWFERERYADEWLAMLGRLDELAARS